MDKAQNLQAQLAMLPGTWAAFCANGVTPATSLVLDFKYNAPSRSAAEALAASLAPSRSGARSEGTWRRSWFVEGQSEPMTTSLEKLQAWVEFMVDAGWRHGCAFDGFGARIP